ncbi:general substrate transporter [Cokeromyces recurvatus]|uniref:general substrate transporter n=1 Tax=Cokeromyces recurvatus TaxID=90255 RepID=UPI00221ED1E0|nr:general substrate transporter [Cokeromyces recurvatus]KAI7898554.1 general substrate transporter [Cokeromyces recurvatus]
MYGYDNGVITSIFTMASFQHSYGINPNYGAGYAVVPIALAASMVASFLSGLIADRLGRKKLFFIATIIHEIGSIIEIASHNKVSFLIGRSITGFSLGIFSMLIPLYQSEIAKPQNRGRLITIYQIFITFGFFVAFWLGAGTFRISTNASWKIPIGCQLVPGLLMLIGLYFIPESPRWLIYKDRNDEALKILARLRSHGNEHDVDVQMEFTGIAQDSSFDKLTYTTPRFFLLLKKGTENNRKRTLLGMGVHTFSQLSGINAILFYLPHILESAGIKELYSAMVGNGVGGAVNFIATLFVLFYIDRCDRRVILIVGALAMAICMITITIISALFNQRFVHSNDQTYADDVLSTIDNPVVSYAILVLLCVFIGFFALSWGPIGWIYPAEIYPQMIRANALAVTTSCSYLFNLFVSLVSPIMFRYILWGTYLFFGVMCFIMAIVIKKFYPETRGRSLEEIQLIFSGALIDQRPDAHHPATAAEALLHLEQIQHRNTLNQQSSFEWSNNMIVSKPLHVTRILYPQPSFSTSSSTTSIVSCKSLVIESNPNNHCSTS